MTPTCNQIELHPYFQQKELVSYHEEKRIQTVAWSPLGTGSWSGVGEEEKPLSDATIASLAEKYSRTPAQIILRWNLQKGIIPVPKSENPDRIKQNIDIFNFRLSEEDIEEINKLDCNRRLGDDPSNADSLNSVPVPD